MTRLAHLALFGGLALSSSLAHAQAAPDAAPRFELAEPMRPAPTRAERGGPIALLAAGGAATLFGGSSLLVVGLQSVDGFEDGAPDQIWLGLGTAGIAIGVPLLFAGIYWLVDELSHSGARSRAQAPPGVLRF